MSPKFTIYYNPDCSTCRKTLELLRKHGIEPEIIEYLKEPPNTEKIRQLVDFLGSDVHAILRAKEARYQELGLSPSSAKEEIVRAITKSPILLERPIVVSGNRAIVARPPEKVLNLL